MEVLVDEIQLKEKSIIYFRQLSAMLINGDKSFYHKFKEEMKINQSQYLMNGGYLIYLLISVIYVPVAAINAVSLLAFLG